MGNHWPGGPFKGSLARVVLGHEIPDKILKTNTSKSTPNFSDDGIGERAKLRRVMRDSMGYEEFNLFKTFEIFNPFELCLRHNNTQSSANETGLYLYNVVTAMMGV